MEWTAYATRSTCPGCVSSGSAYAATDRHSEKSPSAPKGELSGTGVPRNAPRTRMSPNDAARNTADLRRSREVTSPNGFWRKGSPFTYPVPLIRPRPFTSPFTRPSTGRPFVEFPGPPWDTFRWAGTVARRRARSACPFTAAGGAAPSHLGRRRRAGNTSTEAEPDCGESRHEEDHPHDGEHCIDRTERRGVPAEERDAENVVEEGAEDEPEYPDRLEER